MTIDRREVEAKVASVGDGRRRWAQLQAAPRLRDEKVSLVLKRLASRAGLADPDRYSSHSTRRASRPSCAATAPATWRSPPPAAGSAWTRCAATPRRLPSGTIPGPPARAVAMVTVTDFDERREVRADRVLELARRGTAQLARVPPGRPGPGA
jgi:hypothetical protein